MTPLQQARKALEGVLHHNAGLKPSYRLPKSLIHEVDDARLAIDKELAK